MFLMTSIRSVRCAKTEELNQSLMQRRSLTKLRQESFLLWVFLLFLKTKIKLENMNQVAASPVIILFRSETKLQNSIISPTIVE